MDLLNHIKYNRTKLRQKKPLRRVVFNQISGIVKQYGLKKSFLDFFEKNEDHLTAENLNVSRIRVKSPMECPLFSLVSEEEYYLTLSIVDKVDNPYLIHAHSPEEILLCKPLYRINPELGPEKLLRYHFETLYLHELSKRNHRKPTGNDKDG